MNLGTISRLVFNFSINTLWKMSILHPLIESERSAVCFKITSYTFCQPEWFYFGGRPGRRARVASGRQEFSKVEICRAF